MSSNKCLTVLTAALFVVVIFPDQSTAQWAIGASYEIRENTEPKNGFGVRLERGLLGKAPLIDLRLRAHFSSFGDKETARDLTDYDFGAAAIAGVSLGLVKPYVGAGLGSNTIKVDYPEGATADDLSESNLYWNLLGGAEVSALPMIKPFVEYRYSKSTDDFFADPVPNVDEISDSNGRVVFGVSLSF